MPIKESGENYLETILLLQQKKGYVRSIDIANELGYTKASISRAMSILRNNDYIVMDKNGQIQFTDKGRTKADEIYNRHCMITEFLIKALNLPPEIADIDACRIEHIISSQTVEKIKEYLKTHQ